MDPNDPFSFLIQAILGGVVESVAGKALEGAPRLVQRGKALLTLAEQQPLSATEQAVRAAVAAARQDVIDQYRNADIALRDEISRDMVALLNHPPFAEEVARALIFRGQPDLARLRSHYLAPDGASTRWQALEEPLLDFFAAIEDHLLADPDLGPLLRETEKLAMLARIDEGAALIADLSSQAVAVQTQIAASSERGALDIQRLLQVTGRQEAHMAQMVELLAQMLAQLAASAQKPPGHAHTAAVPSTADHPYLRTLRDECNRLPLALTAGKRGGARAADQQPALNQVYVDLQVTAQPTLEQVLARLRVPTAEWPALRRSLAADPRGGRGAPPAIDADAAETIAGELAATWRQLDVARLRSDQDEWAKHPLQPWAETPETLQAALEPLLALEALAAQPQLVLLGNPGSGKSTLVNHLAFTLAGGRLGETPDWQATLHGAFSRPLLPLRVILRRWSASLQPHDPHGLELAYRALAALPTGLSHRELIAAIEGGQALVLFDGLDETPIVAADGAHEIDRRRRIVAAVSAFCTAHPACPVLVTSRVKPYEQAESPYKIGGLPSFTLAKLDDSRIRTFIERWYAELARRDPLRRSEAVRNRDRLLVQVTRSSDLHELAETPILLTMLARINAGQPLPESRAALYHECVEQLLYDWDEIKAEDVRDALTVSAEDAPPPAPTLERLLAAPGVAKKRADFERVLWEVTYAAHKASGRRQADLPAAVLERKLATLHSDRHDGKAWASQVVEFMRQRSGLLIEHEPEVFSFPHPSFQEYLTARWLLEQERCPQEAAALAEYDHWREVILLACGYLATRENAFNRVVSIIDELAAVDGSEPAHWPRLLVAGQAWQEFDGRNRQVSARGAALRGDIPAKLTRLMQTRTASASQRRDAGLLAAAVGDVPAELDGYPVLVPISGLRDGEQQYDFQIGQFPVTNAQYRRFMDDGGYDKTKPWWTPQGIDEIERFWNDWPAAPRLWDDDRYNRSTQPVVGVSWYEAMAYCTWLTGVWRGLHQIGADRAVRLPTEAEWMWGAGGAAGRTYAWGDDFDPACANTAESKLNQPTPVHMYPDGATPAAAGHPPVWDLCGNVWEWTSTKSGTRDWLFLKGGAFYTDADGVKAAARAGVNPGGWYVNWGFRVVVVPVSRMSPGS